ncbi:MAG TPA: sulfite exporter TauE/SafE family protein [Balneolales bacterium]|nr:sulfite exporter TauE/SafE family protein [Balneolales bacterium]
MIWTGFLIGLFGSFHCIGMCGPIAMALPGSNQSRSRVIINRVIYNLGRTISYSMLGILMGLIGKQISLAGFQQILSVIIGIFILTYTLIPFRFGSRLLELSGFQRIILKIQHTIGRLFKLNNQFAMVAIGMLNGLLPCGLVYAGLGGSLLTGSVSGGFVFMILFGFGTMPLMLLTSLIPHFAGFKLRRRINRFIPYAAAILAILFILRGLSLGIPYVSPILPHTGTAIQQVHSHPLHP